MKVAFHTLGCKVNQYETEAMANMFRGLGYQVVDQREFADVYVINTCTVTAIADRKSRQYIRRMKDVNPNSIVAVTGCYAQIDPDAVSGIEGVDIVTGTNVKHRLVELVQERMAGREKGSVPGGVTREILSYDRLGTFHELGTVASTENRTRAYIKVQEGCNRFCSYCVIPYARGPVRSRDLDEILKEAKALLAAGYKELVLTGINTAQYGMEGIDLYSQENRDGNSAAAGGIFGIEKVIKAINELPGDFRIRLSSLEPAVVNRDYVKRLFRYEKLCHHLHMSAQSGSDSILAAMNRPYDRKGYMEMVDALKEFDECYGISTDIIVGFPGETDGDFSESCRLVSECCFCKTHIFRYSRRPETRAAGMSGQIAAPVKKDRAAALEKAAADGAGEFFRRNLEAAAGGRTERVLLEETVETSGGNKYIIGYTGNFIRTYIPYDERLKLNTFAEVSLTEVFQDGMIGLTKGEQL